MDEETNWHNVGKQNEVSVPQETTHSQFIDLPLPPFLDRMHEFS